MGEIRVLAALEACCNAKIIMNLHSIHKVYIGVDYAEEWRLVRNRSEHRSRWW